MPSSEPMESSQVEKWSIAELGNFYTRNRAELYSHALRILKDAALAEEVLQEVVLKIILAAPELKSSEHALSYMHRAIENLCIDIFRLEGRRPNLVLVDDVTAEIDLKSHSNYEYDEEMVAASDAAIIRQALTLLSPAERAAIVMWEVEGRSSLEISRELGIKESAVRHTVSRARTSLRRILAELVIDKERGLTALDLLSATYRKSAKLARKSSKVSMSLFLVLFAFLGFNSLPYNSVTPVSESQDWVPSVQTGLQSQMRFDKSNENSLSNSDLAVKSKKISSPAKSRAAQLTFAGLDKKGIPRGFTVSDSSGSLGSAYFLERVPLLSDAVVTARQIIKTESGAANIFISQTLSTDELGASYRPMVSFGHSGEWIPLVTRLISTEIERQSDGNYLLTAHIAVQSEVESSIRVKASANGRDLSAAPNQITTRLLLDPTKTIVLSQAVFVMEKGASA